MNTSGRAAARDLSRVVHGELLQPGDAGYDAARRTWNGRVDRRPSLIVRCAGVADVVAAVRYGRSYDIELSVRSTGHNATGWALSDGGITVDLGNLDRLHVDPVNALVTAQAGVRWGALDQQTQAFGLATTGGRISTTGVAGLTLGGGYGWLMRRHGLAIDNLDRADLVTADGTFVRASEEEHADLFWGLRGGGGNFGIVTALTFRLHKVGPRVVAGAAFYPVERARPILQWYREFMGAASDELSAQCNFLRAPSAPFLPPHLHGRPVVALAVCHLGSAHEAAHDLSALEDLGEPLAYRITSMPYTKLQRLYDAAGRFGRHVHGRSGHLAALTDRVIDALVEHAPRMQSPHSIAMLSPLGGAVARVGELSTAFSHRGSAFSYAIDAVWTDPAESESSIQWVEQLWSSLRPWSCGVYVNELGDEGPGRVREAYGPRTWARLRAVKLHYDPDNVLHLNQNIPPASNPTSFDEHGPAPAERRARAPASTVQLPAS